MFGQHLSFFVTAVCFPLVTNSSVQLEVGKVATSVVSDTSQMTCSFHFFLCFSGKAISGAGAGVGIIKGNNAGIKGNIPGIVSSSPGSSTRDSRPGSQRYRDDEQKQQRVRNRFLGERGVLLQISWIIV